MKTNAGRFEIDERGHRVILHDADAFAAMRRAGRLAAETLDYIAPFVVPGVSTGALDRRMDAFMRDHGAVPATVGYKGYTKASCISVNHVVTHGIPADDKRLAEGDIANIDVTPLLDGWHGDSSRMYLVGEQVGIKARKLVDVTYEAMMAGIAAVRPGAHLGDIGHAIQTVAARHRYSVVRDFVGHGIGTKMHEEPNVPNFGEPGHGPRLEEGMVFAIEPMVNAGGPGVKVLDDHWTAVTTDGSDSAHFEHTVAVTSKGPWILTRPREVTGASW